MKTTNKKTKTGRSLGIQIIVFSSVFLMTLPWLGYRYMEEMKEFLVQGQTDAQLLAARAIATVLHNRSDLFNITDVSIDAVSEENALYVYPLKHKLVVDGYAGDWNEMLSQVHSFNATSILYNRTDNLIADETSSTLSFNVLLAEYGKYLYGLLRVHDSNIVYRHPGYARLDSSDQIRIELIDKNEKLRRYVLLTEAPGNVSVYEMQEDWKKSLTGKPEYALTAVWKDTTNGYNVEFRLPKEWLNKNQHLLISVADVNNENDRTIDTVVATLKNEFVNDAGSKQVHESSNPLNKLIIRSPELDRILKGLGYADSNICIVDRFRRIRAMLGKAATRDLCSTNDKLAPELINDTLAGKSDLQQTLMNNGENLIIATHPIYQENNIIGAVLVEKNSTDILTKQRQSLNEIIIATLIVFTAAIAGLLLFSSLLAYRIRRLQREVSNTIDQDGRLVNDVIIPDYHSKDEIGELSRSFSTLLSQLKNYTGFLESVPRTLRHEILNPLNTISMTLQKMDSDKTFDGKLITSANKALRQLELIVHSLTEAAHIDGALSQDEKETFDLAELLTEYVSNISLKHVNSAFTYHGPESGIFIQGNDLRITQLLDKLKDNAIDFSTTNSAIKFKLSVLQNNQVNLSVCNKGLLIPKNILSNLCHNILSHRQGVSKTPHLGIGLYVASRIASYHDAQLIIKNNDTEDGVCVLMSFSAVV